MLKSLELFGFKSFADRTQFDFSTGITGVVGPNGSGKSNVVDGLKWILGDQSPKSLRGKEMTDVIFNGAANRKSAAFAEATLVFDNSTGFLNVEHREVRVGRRLWRSGDSEYLLNNAPVRLKDIRQLLMSSDAGSADYSIIEQGRVDQILQANAISRRGIFEEAAGISLYKTRRAEFVRRMERVDQMLARLTDIVDEVDSRRKALRNQAEKAATYRDLSERLRTAWLGLAADDYRLLTGQIESREGDIAEQKARLDDVEHQRSALEKTLEAIDHDMAEVDERIRTQDRNLGSLRETMASHLTTIRLQTKRHEEQHAEFLRLKRQRFRMQDRVHEGEQEVRHLNALLGECETGCRELTEELQSEESRLQRLQKVREDHLQQAEERTQTIETHNERKNALQQDIAELQNRHAQTESAREFAAERSRDLKHQRDECRRQWETSRKQLDDSERELTVLEESVAEAAQRRQTLLDELSSRQSSLAELREQRSACEARITVLDDLERRQEGLGIGVKEILRRAETSPYPPWTHIAGTVADLLDVDLQHAALLEAALGPRAQLIVIEQIEPLQEYLKLHSAEISGRVGFLTYQTRNSPLPPEEGPALRGQPNEVWVQAPGFSVTKILNRLPEAEKRSSSHQEAAVFRKAIQDATPQQPVSRDSVDHETPHGDADREHQEAHTSDTKTITPHDAQPPAREEWLAEQPGVLGRADELAQGRQGFSNLPAQMLADTWIVETLDVAFTLTEQTGGRCRFVTLQGELLDCDGTLTVGTPRAETAVLSRKSELRGLKNELNRLEHRLGEEERRLSETNNHLAEADAQWNDTQRQLEAHKARHAERKSEAAAHKRDAQRCENEYNELQQEITSLQEKAERLSRDIEQRQLELAAAEEDLRGLQAEREETQRKIAQHDQRIQSVQQRRDEHQLKLAKQQERLDGLKEAVHRARQDMETRQQQQQEAARRLATATTKHRDIELAILETRALLAELALSEEQQLLALEAVSAEKDDVRARRGQLSRKEAALRTESNRLQQRIHDAEMTIREAQQRRQSLCDRLAEEYQVDLADIAASEDVSAYREYLNSLNSRESQDGPPSRSDSDSPDAEPVAFEDVRDELEAEVERLRKRVKALGAVNTESLRDLDELEERYTRLKSTLDDMLEAKKQLEDLIRRIDQKCRKMFRETFEAIRENFQQLFRRAFGGGDGDIVLEDPDDVLECGVDIVARPPGKELKNLTLLSGGEKTLTAFALLLALFRYRPSPYCILDEVDAALDEANVERLLALLQEFKQSTQFVIITHKKPTMTIADRLYGVTMEESGVSKRLTVQFENIGENGEFIADGDTDSQSTAA